MKRGRHSVLFAGAGKGVTGNVPMQISILLCKVTWNCKYHGDVAMSLCSSEQAREAHIALISFACNPNTTRQSPWSYVGCGR